MKGMSAFCAVFVPCLLSVAIGYQSFQAQMPNGRNIMHPCSPGVRWGQVGHTTFRNRPSRANEHGLLNVFGEDWKASGYNWKTVCPWDSDGDGRTNGEEMGDPNCEWDWDNQDQARWRNSRPIGHPGFCDNGNAQCSTDDRAIGRYLGCQPRSFRRRVQPRRGSGRTGPPRLPPAIGMMGQSGFNGPNSFSMPGVDPSRTSLSRTPGMSGIPSMPGVPGMSGPGMGGVPGMSGIPSMPGAPGMSGLPSMSGFPSISGRQRFPGAGMMGDPRMPTGARIPGDSSMSGVPSMSGAPAMSGDPRMASTGQTFPGLDRMVGMSVFGSRPGSGAMFPTGAGTFPSPSFMGARSPGIMGRVPSFLRGPTPGAGASQSLTMGMGDGRIPSSNSIGGVVSRTADERMRFPTHVVRGFGSPPFGMRTPGAEGRLPGSAITSYRGRRM